MTRTHVDEPALIELQRDALELFQWLDEKARKKKAEVGEEKAANHINRAQLARDVSDGVDELAEYVRRNRP